VITLKVEIQGSLDSLVNFEENLNAAVEVALDKSAAAILNKLRASFLAETDPEGTAWVPSKAGARRRAKGGTGTLFDTGRLFRSIQLHKTDRGVREIGTDVSYGVKHQQGVDGQVKRVFLGITEAHSKLAHAIFLNEVKKLVNS
jgi:phage gpG-like protein